MTFEMRYPITPDFLPVIPRTGRRMGILMPSVRFIVLHDVGNDGEGKGTTARNNISYYRNTASPNPAILASAHTFIDDREILECIPATLGKPEKAWHVMYNLPHDNRIFGSESNDTAIGVELCYFPNDRARSLEAYKKFVWYCAFLAYHFKLDVNKCFIGHEHLDPRNKIDPSHGLKFSGKSYAQCIMDIKQVYKECLGKSSTKPEVEETEGELTMNQYKELKEEIEKLKAELAKKSNVKGDNANPSEKYKEAIDFVKSNGISDGSNPLGTATRQQVFYMLQQMYDNLIARKGGEVYETHKKAWEKAKELGYLNGENPHAFLTREQFATVVMRILDDRHKEGE